jgi:hypothetical protein
VVLCPLSPPTEGWDLREQHVEAVVERSREAAHALLARRGSKLFRNSEVHYLGT